MKRVLLWILIGSVVLFGGCLILGAVLVALGVEVDETGDNTDSVVAVQSDTPEATSTPKPTSTPTDKDRIAGKHCMLEFQNISEAFIIASLQERVALADLKMVDFKIVPLGHDLNDIVEREHGGVWPDRKKHAAIAEFIAEEADGRRTRQRAGFWVAHDDCDIVLLDIG